MASKPRQLTRKALNAAAGREQVRDGRKGDAVAGVTPRWVATVDGTERAAAVLSVAAEHEIRVVPKGSGSKLDWGGAPEEVDVLLDVSAASGVIEHAAGDLVVRAKAGTPIAELQRVVRAAGQQLAIDHPLPGATVGGVIATGISGPCRHLFGGVRDLLIGVTAVLADGTVAISGGKVVKNVAGYDLGKLYTGCYGTLGVITEAIFRLHPLAAEHRWISVAADDADAAGAAVNAVRQSQQMPTAIEIDRAPEGRITVCAQLEGRPDATDARARALAEAVGSAAGHRATVRKTAPQWWGKLPFDEGVGLRVDVPPSALPALLTEAREAAEREGVPLAVRGSAGLGSVHIGVSGETTPASVRELVAALRKVVAGYSGHVVVLRAPAEVREAVDQWGPVQSGVLAIMRRTKDQFDPAHLLAPGRFVGGI